MGGPPGAQNNPVGMGQNVPPGIPNGMMPAPGMIPPNGIIPPAMNQNNIPNG